MNKKEASEEKNPLSFIFEPAIDQIVEQTEFTIPPPTPLKAPPSLDTVKSKFREYISELFYAKKEEARTEKGLEALFENLHLVPNEAQCRKELMNFKKNYEEELIKPMQEEGILNKILEIDQDAGSDADKTYDEAYQEIVPLRITLGISEEVYKSFYQIGFQSQEKKLYEEAIGIFQFLSQLDVKCHDTYYILAYCHQMLKEWPEAISNYQMACLTDDSDLNAFINLIQCYLAIQDFSNAKYTFEIASHILNNISLEEKEKSHLMEKMKDLKTEIY
jgi:hypothetical protein